MASSDRTSRRGALRTLLRVSAWWSVTGSTVLAGCASVLRRLGREPGTAVGTVDRVPPGGGLRASLGGDDSVIVVNVDGTLRAFRAVCTHEGCPLGWNAQQHLIRCPCHGGAYDTNGHVVSGPPPAPLTELPTIVERGTIYIVK
jgi:Rieske Fe-S protein